ARLELVGPDLAEQARGPADEEALVVSSSELGEGRAQKLHEVVLAAGEGRILEPPPKHGAPELEPGELLVQILTRPEREARVDGVGEREQALRYAARRGDHHQHHDLRLE